MNDIIPAKIYSLHKHRFYPIQKKIKLKKLYLIQITKTYSKTQFAHFIYNTTILWHSKINRKNDTISINCQQWTNAVDKILRIISNFYNQSNYALLEALN